MHEFSHACAAWLCCHTVTGIEVNLEEGGLTHWKGRNVECAKHAVLPAGYLGSALWGAGTLLACSTRVASQTMALVLTAACVVCLGYAICGQTSEFKHRFTMIAVSVGFGGALCGITVACLIGDSFESCDLILEACLIWLAVLNMAYATIDIYDDTIRRSDERSDAYQYAKIWGCCTSRCVGSVWFLISCSLFLGAIVGVMYAVHGSPDEAKWYHWLPGPLALGFAMVYSLLTCWLPTLGGKPTEGKPLLGWD